MTLPTPLSRYREYCARPDFVPDPEQLAVATRLDALYHALLAQAAEPPAPRWMFWRRQPVAPVKGLYLWGGVGRGKTLLVDLFHGCLPPALGRRIHFHSFMRDVHAALKQLRGTQDPLDTVAEDWSRTARVLCLDEFHVVDITDAMLLAQLLEALFARGVTLVTTSNEAPSGLYRGGLQRERFLPAIALLERQLDVIEFTGGTDYRWRTLIQAATYYSPADAVAEEALARRYAALTRGPVQAAAPLCIEGRSIPVRAYGEGVVWFDFEALCDGPRGTGDYIEIACCFHTVLLSGVPAFGEDASDAARRFINLVDAFYDRGVNLLLSAAAAPDALYRGTRLAAPFRRTASRLVEMQSEAYLARPHISETESINSLIT